MSKKSFTVPLTVESQGLKRKLLYLQFNSDSSVYVVFPRKKGYRIIKDNPTVKLAPGINQISLGDSAFSTVEENPYITFHPGKGINHISTQQTRRRYAQDAAVVEMSDEPNASIFPLCTLTFSDMSFLDAYAQKSGHSHELGFIERKSEKHLSLEVWLHSSDRIPLPSDFPQPEGVLNVVTLREVSLGDYTASIRVRENDKTPTPEDEIEVRGVHVAVWRKGSPSMFLMIPPEDKYK